MFSRSLCRPQILILLKLNDELVPKYRKMLTFSSQLKAGRSCNLVLLYPWLLRSSRVPGMTDDLPSPHRPVHLAHSQSMSHWHTSCFYFHGISVFSTPHYVPVSSLLITCPFRLSSLRASFVSPHYVPVSSLLITCPFHLSSLRARFISHYVPVSSLLITCPFRLSSLRARFISHYVPVSSLFITCQFRLSSLRARFVSPHYVPVSSLITCQFRLSSLPGMR